MHDKLSDICFSHGSWLKNLFFASKFRRDREMPLGFERKSKTINLQTNALTTNLWTRWRFIVKDD